VADKEYSCCAHKEQTDRKISVFIGRAKGKAVKDRQSYKVAAICFAAAACVILFCSCLSFNLGDAPSKYVWPRNQPPENWCGPIGAFLAYYIMYYIGPGAFVLLAGIACLLVLKLSGRRISQPVLRSIGLGLLVISASCSVYLLRPYSVEGLPSGNGGILGISLGIFLKKHFAFLGTSVIMVSTWIVGAVLLADIVVVALMRFLSIGVVKTFGVAGPAWAAARQHSQVLGEIWQKLSIRQKGRDTAEVPSLTSGYDKQPGDVAPAVRDEAAGSGKVQKASGGAIAIPREPKPSAPYVSESYDDYTFPPLELLAEPEYSYAAVQDKVIKAKASVLEKLLEEFSINARVVAAETGPVITMFELELAPGIKVSQISNLANDMARALGASAVRVVAPLPGKHTIGIEVPNSEKEKVRMKDLITLAANKPNRMHIPLFLGKDSSGEALVSDLTTMPHLLIAGTTGSGKSVCINSIITSLLLTKRPDEVKLILIDPKMVEMTAFSTIPHLMCPIVTEIKRAERILEWATVKMDERYALIAEARVKNIAAYNELGAEEIIERFNPTTDEEQAKIPKQLPFIIIIIDELADMMMTSAKEIENYIVRLAQKSRAVGIHMVLATQRPQATVVTGLIKSNLPTRISFRVAARMDSRIILDQNGAETLLGQGDMLFLKPGTSDLVRAQGTFVDETEVRRIVKHLKTVAEPQFHPELAQLNRIDVSEMGRDELFDEAVRIVLESRRGSVSLLQRRLSIGYARASRIIEMMAASGVLGEYKGSQAREVLMTPEDYERVRKQMEGFQGDTEAGYKDLAEDEDVEDEAGSDEEEYEYVSNDEEVD